MTTPTPTSSHAQGSAHTEAAAGDLLPCPFCGGDAHFGISMSGLTRGGHFIACDTCEASTNVRFAEKEDPGPILRDAWNARVGQPPKDPSTAKLRKALGNLVDAIEGGRQASISAAVAKAEDLMEEVDG